MKEAVPCEGCPFFAEGQAQLTVNEAERSFLGQTAIEHEIDRIGELTQRDIDGPITCEDMDDPESRTIALDRIRIRDAQDSIDKSRVRMHELHMELLDTSNRNVHQDIQQAAKNCDGRRIRFTQDPLQSKFNSPAEMISRLVRRARRSIRTTNTQNDPGISA